MVWRFSPHFYCIMHALESKGSELLLRYPNVQSVFHGSMLLMMILLYR